MISDIINAQIYKKLRVLVKENMVKAHSLSGKVIVPLYLLNPDSVLTDI